MSNTTKFDTQVNVSLSTKENTVIHIYIFINYCFSELSFAYFLGKIIKCQNISLPIAHFQ